MIITLYNAVAPTTAVIVPRATGAAALRTMLQAHPLIVGRCIGWGFSGDNNVANVPGVVELIETGTVFASGLTALAAADAVKTDSVADQPATSTFLSFGTGATGYTAGAAATEGTVTASRLLDGQQIAGTNQYLREFSLGRAPLIQAANALRIRAHFATTVNIIVWMQLEF